MRADRQPEGPTRAAAIGAGSHWKRRIADDYAHGRGLRGNILGFS